MDLGPHYRLGGCSGCHNKTRNTASRRRHRGVAGAVLTDGSAIGTVGGAVSVAVIGKQVNTNR